MISHLPSLLFSTRLQKTVNAEETHGEWRLFSIELYMIRWPLVVSYTEGMAHNITMMQELRYARVFRCMTQQSGIRWEPQHSNGYLKDPRSDHRGSVPLIASSDFLIALDSCGRGLVLMSKGIRAVMLQSAASALLLSIIRVHSRY